MKDLIDVAGLPTTAGCRAVADQAEPAGVDAACLAGLRAAIEGGRARLAGKAGLDELAIGATGVNPWYGTPRNPVGPGLVPGGSSSGSASAVATGAADLAVGTDTGGSVRIPAACCGVVGLKTTYGRVPTTGVWPLAPSLDTVGALAPDVAGVAAAAALLDPTFDVASALAAPTGTRIGRGRPDPALAADPAVEAAVDTALDALGGAAGVRLLPGWAHATRAGLDLLGAEVAHLHGHLPRSHPGEVGEAATRALARAARVGRQRHRDAMAYAPRWRATLEAALDGLDALAMPTIGIAPPRADDPAGLDRLGVAWTMPVNLAGLPAIAIPVPTGSGPPASLQLIGAPGADEQLCALAAAIELAVGGPGHAGG